MCGITGVLNFDGMPVNIDVLRSMTNAIAHRGPDGDGHYVVGPVGLGHRRLAIIDLSLDGRQPMCNEDETIWVTFNGEIYNFAEVRRDLESRGHRFRSHTDTEVIVHAYEEWGVNCLQYFNGMFAFALWDARQRQLWLVRDRLGIKPLFYAHTSWGLLFGSEIKAILAHPRFTDRTIDYQALAYYAAVNYTPAPYTLFAGVQQLLPGHHLLIDELGHMQDRVYWDIPYHDDQPTNRSEASYIDEFNALLSDSVRLRLVSDVPFGAFLSGGVDSSTVTYWMAQQMREPVKTFSIGFSERTFDELVYAQQVSTLLHTDHQERIVTADAAALLTKLVWHAEEPTADSSMVAVYYLAQLAREKVTMVLSGDGADEILAGYETYQAYYLHNLYRRIPALFRHRLLQPLINGLPSVDGKVSLDYKLKQFVRGTERSTEDAHASWRMIFDADARHQLFGPIHDRPGIESDITDLYHDLFSTTSAHDPLNRLLYVDTRLYLPNDMLVKVDRMTMAHGLEAREPFLDYRLVEFAASVPPRLKLKQMRHKKYLLKAAMKGRLPANILWRKKAGFNVPNARWIKQGLKPFVLDHLSPQRISDMGLLDTRVVTTLLNDHFAGKADHSHRIWCLLTLSLWWQQFIDQPISVPV